MVLGQRPVTNAPLPDQGPIPYGDWDMQLSWSVPNSWMAIKIPELHERGEPWQWAFKECAGRGVVQGCDAQIGRILLRASVELDGDMIRFWRPDDAVPHIMVPGPYLFPSQEEAHDRMCYQRATQQFRVLDENISSPTFRELTLGSGYVGDIVINWLERGSHIFHDGPMKQPELEGLFHLYDPLIEYGQVA